MSKPFQDLQGPVSDRLKIFNGTDFAGMLAEIANTWMRMWTVDRGLWTVDCGAWIGDRGPRTKDRGSWMVDHGPRTVEQGQGTKDRGPKTKDRMWTSRTCTKAEQYHVDNKGNILANKCLP